MENSSDKTLVTDQSVVALTWIMKDMQGEVLDELQEPVEFLVGGDDLLEAIDEALLEHKVGDNLELHLEPHHAFGDYDEEKVYLEARKWFPAELEEGMAFDGHALPAGCNADIPKDALYIVTDIYPDHVVLDGNHPLAGIGLELRIKIHSVREATVDEVGRGSAGTGFFKLESGSTLMPGNDTLH
ncbi:FKBP-type peptidyl-prolyl cis-trans isomerase [Brachymonas denitrificans]|jgi:FKBP-type peptidyl-prolyl cis-trans isomerase SlyD|uniref:Peptidyl-prolyl cis-trans isomerase n=1 Tax=Brachymonas denitrificans DSM 15123 TaxID=1121117 RepID=A0A1H8J1P5_9BURK|nr:FKBP-type peptidyl-prolyl cis-trans isomerase [Brachymonas denitrificans]SEN74196.1 FKBP-type peptidyl-prolyl cis-trans isomerase SlyD [Brachymonas denitrificans DSM 15123]